MLITIPTQQSSESISNKSFARKKMKSNLKKNFVSEHSVNSTQGKTCLTPYNGKYPLLVLLREKSCGY